ncbi:MAG TPA: DUF1934 domain-containing protein [Peptostreptococcaceae bacterium]|nr:DUF1934 domain-containing protein [Peptostreptococcaceae bacterium]
MEKIMIKIKSEQINEYGEKDTMEFISEGKLYTKNNNIYLTYEESEITGMENTTTTIKIQNNEVVIKRFGKNNSTMVFDKYKKYISKYETAQGNFNMEIITGDINIDIKEENKIKIYINYQIRIDGLFEGNNTININVN